MLKEANNLCRRLWRDESGVVLVLTMVVFLTLFVIGCTVYAVGENIRQRIELQNAADAAAYSAAVVQADALSRIAAINKAMAWTYVQMVRAVMDYDEDVWLEWTLKKWQNRFDSITQWFYHGFGEPPHCGGDNFWVGNSRLQNLEVWIHKTRWVSIFDLRSTYNSGAATQSRWHVLQPEIYRYRNAIRWMNQAETNIISSLQDRIEEVATAVLRRNCTESDRDPHLFSLLTQPASAYTETLTDEARLLKFFDAGSATDAYSLFGKGIDAPQQHADGWFVLQPGDGIQRRYVQKKYLRAEWWWHGERWLRVGKLDCARRVLYQSQERGHDVVTGWDAKTWGNHTDPYYETELAQPQILTEAYFKRPGAIIVGVARRMSNPLWFMAGSQANPGLFAFFTPQKDHEKDRYSWAVAAARAGYFDADKENEQDSGKYNPTASSLKVSDWLGSAQNLSEVDWDALLIPLHKAWEPQGGSGTKILSTLWTDGSAEWRPLYGTGPTANRLSRVASGSAPRPLMRGEISFPDEMESMILH